MPAEVRDLCMLLRSDFKTDLYSTQPNAIYKAVVHNTSFEVEELVYGLTQIWNCSLELVWTQTDVYSFVEINDILSIKAH